MLRISVGRWMGRSDGGVLARLMAIAAAGLLIAAALVFSVILLALAGVLVAGLLARRAWLRLRGRAPAPRHAVKSGRVIDHQSGDIL